MTKQIEAYEDCKACNGTGTVYDSVDWWGTTTQMPSVCECCVDRAFEDGLLTEEEWDNGDFELVGIQEQDYDPTQMYDD